MKYYSNGKLLITGEYLVLRGAEALALPLVKGQRLEVEFDGEPGVLTWEAVKPDGLWFNGKFRLKDFEILTGSDVAFAERLKDILFKARLLNPGFPQGEGLSVKTFLEFDPEFGFGSSSTLIVNLARWADVDPYQLQNLTFHGSGYDIACGMANRPVIYRLDKGVPKAEEVGFSPNFSDQLYFVYLGKKQRSLEEVQRFKEKKIHQKDVAEVDRITRGILQAESLDEFEHLMLEHEEVISKILEEEKVQEKLFPDYRDGIVKSLGAWGGDFVLVTSRLSKSKFVSEMNRYGFKTIFGFNELVL